MPNEIMLLSKSKIIIVSPRKFVKEMVVESPDKITIFQSELGSKHPKTILEEWLREKARKIIEERAKDIAVKNDFEFNKIAIREQSTRWGSCSSEKNLNFNWKLIMAPKEVMDYVIVHELCHTKQMNHSRNFWDLVETIMPNYSIARKWLRTQGHLLKLG